MSGHDTPRILEMQLRQARAETELLRGLLKRLHDRYVTDGGEPMLPPLPEVRAALAARFAAFPRDPGPPHGYSSSAAERAGVSELAPDARPPTADVRERMVFFDEAVKTADARPACALNCEAGINGARLVRNTSTAPRLDDPEWWPCPNCPPSADARRGCDPQWRRECEQNGCSRERMGGVRCARDATPTGDRLTEALRAAAERFDAAHLGEPISSAGAVCSDAACWCHVEKPATPNPRPVECADCDYGGEWPNTFRPCAKHDGTERAT